MCHTVLKEQMSKMAEGAARWKMAATKFARQHPCGPGCCCISENV